MVADMNTRKEGKGQAVHEELELHQSHGALLTRRTEGFLSASMWRGEGSGMLHAGWQFTPQRGLTPQLSRQQQLPAAKLESHCSSRVLHAFPKEADSALLLQKRTVLVEESHAE